MRTPCFRSSKDFHLRVILGHDGHVAEVVAVGEGHGLAPGVRGGDGGGADVELLVLNLGREALELRRGELHLEAKLGRHGLQEFVVVPGEVAVLINEDVGRRVGKGADLEGAVGDQAELGLVDLVQGDDVLGGVLVQRLLVAAGEGVVDEPLGAAVPPPQAARDTAMATATGTVDSHFKALIFITRITFIGINGGGQFQAVWRRDPEPQRRARKT